MSNREVYENPRFVELYGRQSAEFWKDFPDYIVAHFANHIKNNFEHPLTLNVGSGTGGDTNLLLENGLDVINIDISSLMAQKTHSLGQLSIQGSMFQLPFADETFSGAWVQKSAVEAFNEDIPLVLDEVRRVLRPSGMMSIGMIQGERTETRTSKVYGIEKKVTHITRRALKEILHHAKFFMIAPEGHSLINRVKSGNTTYMIVNCIKRG